MSQCRLYLVRRSYGREGAVHEILGARIEDHAATCWREFPKDPTTARIRSRAPPRRSRGRSSCEEKMIIEALETGKVEWAPPPMPATMKEVLDAYDKQSADISQRWKALPAERWDGALDFFGQRAAGVADGVELPLRHRPSSRPDHDLPAADGIDRPADLRTERRRALKRCPAVVSCRLQFSVEGDPWSWPMTVSN